MLTIGELAKRVGMRSSALRYYEQEGLLTPDGRSPSGYRLYNPTAEQRLRLIHRAQRLGFSLADIRTLLHAWDTGHLSSADLIRTAEDRHLALERQLTELLILKHELELFLQDLHHQHERPGDDALFASLLERVCANPLSQPPAQTMLDWLARYTGCVLTSDAAGTLLQQLAGQHVHIWQEDDAYHILVVSGDTAVATALQKLAQLEANCQVHQTLTPEFLYDDEGYHLIARGENAFIFARLFLALESVSSKQ
ncbi:MAG: MerR family transcriptional regulator [Ardenticatenaceae bacterium]|nr:MerR family transcriptional regulator [Anaerolineales bacterium]MCB8922230.1 MerR family transcriptional regulator [Ardenticatenaceae bacterium]MCB8990585.1 MerR family transcriptional regulator [Ardenticatenaceae bacterium]